MGLLYAIVTVLAWGTWLAPSQRVSLPSQQTRAFYVSVVNLLVATVVAWVRGFGGFSFNAFWLPLLGGVVWAMSGLCAFTASNRIGMAKAFGIWAPLNILVSLVCGRLLFGELAGLDKNQQALLAGCIALIIGGVLLIVFAKGPSSNLVKSRAQAGGLLAAVGAGVLWGVYFIPVKMAGVSLWTAAFPLGVGMFVGCGTLLLLARAGIRLREAKDYAKLASTGILWTIGDYGMLLLVDTLGAGKGYTIAQLSVVVNATVGIYVLHDPPARSKAAWMTLAGCLIATVGGILLGRVQHS